MKTRDKKAFKRFADNGNMLLAFDYNVWGEKRKRNAAVLRNAVLNNFDHVMKLRIKRDLTHGDRFRQRSIVYDRMLHEYKRSMDWGNSKC